MKMLPKTSYDIFTYMVDTLKLFANMKNTEKGEIEMHNL